MNAPVQPQKPESGTDVGEFLSDLDGGQLERKLSLALSQVAAASIDNNYPGEVTLKFTLSRITGTSQVQCKHTLKFTRPTMSGKASEEESRATVMHVGKYGRLSLVPETQMKMFQD